MDNSITKMLKDEPLAIITDSASLKNDSATAILASCAKFKQPILLEVLFSNNKSKNEENDVYSADLFAQDLQRTMNNFGINISTQVVCHMGDNVAYNKAVSNWPTSSIAAERVFASARTITSATRGGQSNEAFAKELKLKINQRMLHEELASCLNIVQNAAI